jgi:acetylglutamate kinase
MQRRTVIYYNPIGNKITQKTTRNIVKPVTGKKYSNEIIQQLNIDGGMANKLQITSDNFNDYFSNNSR